MTSSSLAIGSWCASRTGQPERGRFSSRIGVHDVKDRSLTWGAIAIFRMENGKIAEEWVRPGQLEILLSGGILEAKRGAR